MCRQVLRYSSSPIMYEQLSISISRNSTHLERVYASLFEPVNGSVNVCRLVRQLVGDAAFVRITTCIPSSSRLSRMSARVCLTSRMATCSSLSSVHLTCTSWHVRARTVASNSAHNTNSPRRSDSSQRACLTAGSSWPPLTTVCILGDAMRVPLRPNRNACAGLCVRWNGRVRSHLHSMCTHNSCTHLSEPQWSP